MKNVVVVGGCGLLGKAIVKSLKTSGNSVAVFDIVDYESLEINNTGADYYFKADINSEKSISSGIESTVKSLGGIDCVVNTSYPRNDNKLKKLTEIPLHEFNQNINVHLGGYFNVMQSFIVYFLGSGGGNIINISSIQGVSAPKFEHYVGTSMMSGIEYTASKSAIIAMSRYSANYLKGKNISINCVSPGGIFDGQPDSFLEKYNASCINKGMLDPEDLVGAVKFLVSDDSKYINGQNIIVDDGWSL